jgi:regulatory protein
LKIPDAEKTIQKVLERLKELRYLDDGKILEDYFEYRLKTRPQGKFLFLREMHRRGIPFEKAREEWEKRDIEEKPLALELVKKRERQLKGLPPVLRKKRIASLLASRGFSPETVWGILEKV